MPTETRRYLEPERRTGLNLYAKLLGSVTTPHSTGTIEPTEIGSGYYDFAGLDTAESYTIQEEVVAGTKSAADTLLSVSLPELLTAERLGKIDSIGTEDIDGYTVEEAMRVVLAVLAGKASGGGTGTELFRAVDDSKVRVTTTTTTTGNRTTVTVDAT